MEPITQTPRHLLLAAGTSITATIVAAWWWLTSSRNLFGDPHSALLREWLTPAQTAAVMVALGLLGAVLSAAAVRVPAVRPHLSVPATGMALGTLGLFGWGVIAVLGYLVALLMPFALALVVVQLVRRGGAGRWVALAAPAVALGTLLATGVLTREALPVLVHVPRLVVEQLGTIASEGLIVALLAAWVVTAARGEGGAVGAWVLRHRRPITVLAALGPLPYALARLTWLTPWPVLAPGGLSAETRLWGMMLSLGAWAGIALTIGLIRPWGEVFPRWVPLAGGRPVPVGFAAGPGGLVAMTVTGAAVPFAIVGAPAGSSPVEALIVLPFWYWGPMLGLAVWGYVLHRRAHEQAGAVRVAVPS